MIVRDRIVRTFLGLVAIDSPSGDEDAMAAALVARFQALGVEASQDSHGNVLGRLPGEGEPLLLSAHMDTVEPGRGIKPVFDGDDIIRSDGSTILGADNKAGCALILEVVQSLREDGGAHRPIELAISRGEEVGLTGARAMDYSRITAKVALVIDSGGPPTSIQGQAPFHNTYDIEVFGRSAHAGLEPEKGVSAIMVAAEIVAGLPQGRFDSETTGNVGRISGGLVRNAVPDYCRIEGEIRSMSQARLEALEEKARAHVDAVRCHHSEAKVVATFRSEYPGYLLTEDDPAARVLYGALRKLGMTPEPHPVGGGTDGNIFRGHGIASVVFGRGGYNQHTKDEYLVIPELLDCARVVELAIRTP